MALATHQWQTQTRDRTPMFSYIDIHESRAEVEHQAPFDFKTELEPLLLKTSPDKTNNLQFESKINPK
jgi:hypothetical protein